MTEPSLAVQTAVRARLVASPALVGSIAAAGLVPEGNIFDRSKRPEAFPCIIIGDGQTICERASYSKRLVTVHSDIHVWVESESLAGAKRIVGAIDKAVRAGAYTLDGFDCIDFFVRQTRFLRDPSGTIQHAVMSVEALVEEVL